jgi:succinate-semialdehyde dehydrogenase/glutarate-semialdehyde dehydrogenase
VYVQKGDFKQFESMLVEAVKNIRVGHGAAPGTTMSALTTDRAVDKLERHVADAKRNGATIMIGGKQLENLSGIFSSQQ